MPRLSLRAKLLASFLLILLPVLGLLMYGYSEANERRLDAVLNNQMQTAQAVAALVDASFDEALTLGWSLANDPVVRSLDPFRVDAHLQRVFPLNPQYVAIGVLNATGDNVGTSMPFAPGTKRAGLGADRPYFQEAMATGKPAISTVIVARIPPAAVSVGVAVPIRDEAGNTAGVVVVGPRLESLSSRLEGVALRPEQHILLTDTAGTAAFYTALPDLPWEQRNISTFEPVRAALEGKSTTLRSYVSPLLNDTRVGAFVSSPKYGWVVGVTEREDMALAPVRATLRDQLLGFGAVVVLSFALMLLVSERLLGPIRRLTGHALGLGRGELSRRVRIKTGDEMEELGRTFNQMADAIMRQQADLQAQNVELRAKSAELSGILTSSPTAIYVTDEHGAVRHANKVALALIGAERVEEISRPVGEWFLAYEIRDKDGRPLGVEEVPLARVGRGERFQNEEVQFRDPKTGAAVWVLASGEPLADEIGRVIGGVLVCVDITERKRAEAHRERLLREVDEERQRAEVLAAEAEELAAEREENIVRLKELDQLKDQFIAVAAHELKTPVAIMKGYAQALLRPAEAVSERQRKMLEAVDRGSNRIDAVVQDLLDISRLHAGRLDLELEKVDLLALTTEVVDRMAVTAPTHGLRVVTAEQAFVRADRSRLEQVIVNLLVNAIKYSPNGGDVEVSVVRQNGQAIVSVADHGVGIPKEKQENVFQRFYRAHDRTPYDYGGMGVGLHISKEIVTRHGGQIWFESEEGKGSTFYFSLPLLE